MGKIRDFFRLNRRRKGIVLHEQSGAKFEFEFPPDNFSPLEAEPSFPSSPPFSSDGFSESEDSIGSDLSQEENQQPEISIAVSREDELLNEDSSTDELYAHHIRARIVRERSTSPMGKLMKISIVGVLKDGSIAWTGEDDSSFGQSTAELFQGFSPEAGDEVRAKVIGYPWGCSIGALLPDTYSRAEDVDRGKQKPLSAPSDFAGIVPVAAVATWRQTLRPGDLVLAHVPFDGTYGTTRNGRISKNRPAMFVRWAEDYAIVRPIYGAGKHVDRSGLGTQLLDASFLNKNSVIRNSEMDLKVDDLLKPLGRLGARDLKQFGYGADVSERPGTKRKNQPKEVLRLVPELVASSPINLPYVKAVDPVKIHLRKICESLMQVTDVANYEDVLYSIVLKIVNSDELQKVLHRSGVGFSEIGTILGFICTNKGIDNPKGAFTTQLQKVMERINLTESLHLFAEVDQFQLPVLKIDRDDASEVEPVQPADSFYATFVLPDDYVSPDLVILDQVSVGEILGVRRISFQQVIEDVRPQGDTPCILIGPNDSGELQRLHNAASLSGWIVVKANNPGERLEAVMDARRMYEAEIVTLISSYADVVAELENIGCDVQIVNELNEDELDQL